MLGKRRMTAVAVTVALCAGHAPAGPRETCFGTADPGDGAAACEAALEDSALASEEKARLLGALGSHRLRDGDAARALDAYKLGLALRPARAGLLFGAARAEQGLGRHAAAADGYGRAIAAGEGGKRVYNNRGVALFELGETEAAIADFTTALSLDPDYGNAWNNRANAHCRLGRVAEAVGDRIMALYARRFSAAAAQAGLRKTGFYSGPADGIWGTASEEALRAWTVAGCPRAPETRVD